MTKIGGMHNLLFKKLINKHYIILILIFNYPMLKLCIMLFYAMTMVRGQDNECVNKTDLVLTYKIFYQQEPISENDKDLRKLMLEDTTVFVNSLSDNCLFTISMIGIPEDIHNFVVVWYYSKEKDETTNNGSFLYPALLTFLLFYV